MLGVAPESHGCGVGRALVQSGLDRARQDNLPAVVVCAKGVEGFYRKLGFVIDGGNVTNEDQIRTQKDAGREDQQEVLINPLRQRGIGGGAVLWTQ